MKLIHGLHLCSKEGTQVGFEKDDDEVYVSAEAEHFSADFALPRRQARELRDWLNEFLDD